MAFGILDDSKIIAISDALRDQKLDHDENHKYNIDDMPEVIRELTDVSKDSVTAGAMLSGITAHDANQNIVTGTIPTVARASTSMSVTADDTANTLKFTGSNNQSAGYLASGGNKSASSTATLTMSSSGANVTATVSESASNKSISHVLTLPTSTVSKTFTPSASKQTYTVSAGYTDGGTVTCNAISYTPVVIDYNDIVGKNFSEEVVATVQNVCASQVKIAPIFSVQTITIKNNASKSITVWGLRSAKNLNFSGLNIASGKTDTFTNAYVGSPIVISAPSGISSASSGINAMNSYTLHGIVGSCASTITIT